MLAAGQDVRRSAVPQEQEASDGDRGRDQADEQKRARTRTPTGVWSPAPARPGWGHDHRRALVAATIHLGEARLELDDEVAHRLEAVGGILRHRTLNRKIETQRAIGPM